MEKNERKWKYVKNVKSEMEWNKMNGKESKDGKKK